MKIDKTTIAHLERLARIELTPDELERLGIQLDKIIEYIRLLQTVDTDDVEPTAVGVTRAGAELRPDRVGKCLDRKTVLAKAPDTEKHLFRVPRIIER